MKKNFKFELGLEVKIKIKTDTYAVATYIIISRMFEETIKSTHIFENYTCRSIMNGNVIVLNVNEIEIVKR